MQREGNKQLRTPYGQYSNNLYQYTSGPMPAGDGKGGGKPDFTPWFGAPLRDIKTNPYEGYSAENYDLPEAYVGQNPFLSRVIVTLITDDDMWITRVALPMRTTNAQGEIMWNIWTFDNHALTNVPEEGVSRLLSSKMLTRRGHYERFGLAFILEHGFMNTEQGRMCYEMNLVQIKNAILETLYYGGIEEYLMCKRHNELWSKRHGSRMSVHTVRETMQLEVDNWACIQKQDGGWDMLDSRSKRQLQDTGSSPNMWIIPRGMKPYIALDKAATSYFMRGPDGNALLDSAKNGQNVSYVDTANNCQIFESKAFQMPGQEEPLDLLYRDRSVGEYYLMVDHLPAISYKGDTEYKSAHRTIYVYDESTDRMKPIMLNKAMEDCYWPEGPNYGAKGDDTDPENSMFYCYDVEAKEGFETTVKRVHFLGELEKEYLNTDIVGKMADVIMKKVSLSEEEKAAFTEMVSSTTAAPSNTTVDSADIAARKIYTEIKEVCGDDSLMTSPEYSSPPGRNQTRDGLLTFLQNACMIGIIGQTATGNRNVVTMNNITVTALTDAIKSATGDENIAIRAMTETRIDAREFLKDVKYYLGGSSTPTDTINERFEQLNNTLGTEDKKKAFYALAVLISYKYTEIFKNSPTLTRDLNKLIGRMLSLVPTEKSNPDVALGILSMAYLFTKLKDPEFDVTGFDIDRILGEDITVKVNEVSASVPIIFAVMRQQPQGQEASFRSFLGPANARKTDFIAGRLTNTTLRTGDKFVTQGTKRVAEETFDEPSKARFGVRVFRDGEAHAGQSSMDIETAYSNKYSTLAINGVELNLGQMFKTRFDAIAKETDKVRRAIKLSILGMKFTKDAMNNLIDKDIPVPIGILAVRPYITHNMGTAILTTSGAEVGETLVGRADFQLTDNVVQKMHYGNFTFYARNIIYHPEKVLVVTDIISRRYVGGNDMDVFKQPTDLASFRNGVVDAHKSFIFMAIPCSEDAVRQNPIDLTGKFDETNSDLDLGKVHFPNAPLYAKHWQFSHHQSNQQKDYFEYYNSLNTVCYQGHQMNYDPHQENYSRVVLNTGHWGYRVYEGCKAVRNGAMKLLKEVDYNSGSGPVPNVPLGY